MKSLLVGLVVSSAVLGAAQSVEVKCLVSEGQAYAFGNPRQIAVGLGVGVQPSPDGRFVAFRRFLPMDPLDELSGKQPVIKVVFSVFDVAENRLWDVSQAEGMMQFQFAWAKEPGQAILTQSRLTKVDGKDKMEVEVSRIAAAQRQKSASSRYLLEPGTLVDPSPDGHHVLVSSNVPNEPNEVLDVTTGSRAKLPQFGEGAYKFWGPGGVLVVHQRTGNSASSSVYDFNTQKLTPYTGQGADEPDEQDHLFYVFSRQLAKKEGGANVLVASSLQAWEKEGSADAAKQKTERLDKLIQYDRSLLGPVVLDADPMDQTISNKGKFVAYAKRGGVYICPFSVVDPEALEKVLANRARTKAMSQSKQVALAIIMYASDFDDKYPPNSDWANLIDPYMRNRELSNGFNYALDGIDMTRIDSPAETIMGSVDTPWGRAIAYADGHVKWLPAVSPQTTSLLTLVADDRRRGELAEVFGLSE